MIPNYNYILIVGCGQMGAILANHLSRAGSSVVVIDPDEESFKNLSSDFSGFRIVREAAEMEALREGGIEKADCVLAVTRKDNVNLMVAQVAKVVYKVPKVIARVYDPEREEVYSQFGIETISPTSLTAKAFLHALSSAEGENES